MHREREGESRDREQIWKGLSPGGSEPFQEKHWNEDMKFQLHSASFSFTSWWLHALHKHSAGTRIQSGAVLNFKRASNFPNIWNIPLLESQPQTVPYGVPPRDGVHIVISLSPLFLVIDKAEFTAKVAKTNAQFIQVTCKQ